MSRRLRRWLDLVAAVAVGTFSGWLLATVTAPDGVAAGGDGRGEAVAEAGQVDADRPAEVVDVTAPVATSEAPTDHSPAAPTVSIPFPPAFEPAANEVQRDAKRTGTAVAYHLTNYDPGGSVTDLVASVTVDPDQASALAPEAEVVHHADMWSRGTVEYAQLGGHSGDRISVIVVVRQELGTVGTDEPERVETRTMDIRLVKDAFDQWELERVASTGGEPISRPADLSPLAASVVDNARIDLPDSAIWDIYSGHTRPAVLRFMADLAERTPYKVVVLHTGHPHYVFGTDRVSNHTVGLAVDIYELASTRVIDSHDETSLVYDLSEQMASRPDVREFGSPWLFEGVTARTFTNEVHHDHLHIGVVAGG